MQRLFRTFHSRALRGTFQNSTPEYMIPHDVCGGCESRRYGCTSSCHFSFTCRFTRKCLRCGDEIHYHMKTSLTLRVLVALWLARSTLSQDEPVLEPRSSLLQHVVQPADSEETDSRHQQLRHTSGRYDFSDSFHFIRPTRTWQPSHSWSERPPSWLQTLFHFGNGPIAPPPTPPPVPKTGRIIKRPILAELLDLHQLHHPLHL